MDPLEGVSAPVKAWFQANTYAGPFVLLSAFAAGKNQLAFCTQSALLGGNCRVGLEDSLYIGKGRLASSNAQQVEKVRTILDALDIDDATLARSRGAAINQACAALPYYLDSYPLIVERSWHKLAALGVSPVSAA